MEEALLNKLESVRVSNNAEDAISLTFDILNSIPLNGELSLLGEIFTQYLIENYDLFVTDSGSFRLLVLNEYNRRQLANARLNLLVDHPPARIIGSGSSGKSFIFDLANALSAPGTSDILGHS